MDILVVGSDKNFDELKLKLGESHKYIHIDSHINLPSEKLDVVFDFLADTLPENICHYKDLDIDLVFCQSMFKSLFEIWQESGNINKKLYGFNGFPGFVNRDYLEISLLNENDIQSLNKFCKTLGLNFIEVADKGGLISARVVCMIINEAYFTVQEGTATKKDIDIGMKLGTNYPKGPFEWLEEIGIENVYRLLEVLFEDSKDERYKICPLLKSEFLKISSIQQ